MNHHTFDRDQRGLAAAAAYKGMDRLPPFRERTPRQLREQARKYREAAAAALPGEAAVLLRLAEHYETLATLREEECTLDRG